MSSSSPSPEIVSQPSPPNPIIIDEFSHSPPSPDIDFRGSSADTTITSPPMATTTMESNAPTETSPNESPENTVPAAPVVPIAPITEELGRGMRQKEPSTRLKPYVTYSASCEINHVLDDTSSASASSGTCLYPIANFVNCERFSSKHAAFLANITLNTEPLYFKDAVQFEVWRKSMGYEVDALEINHTWSLTKLPPGKKALTSKWVYKIKYNADGTIERHKSRLVVMGNHQE